MGTLYSATEGLLDWFEIDKGFTELPFIQIDLCVLCVFVLYSCVSLSSCPFLTFCTASPARWVRGLYANSDTKKSQTIELKMQLLAGQYDSYKRWLLASGSAYTSEITCVYTCLRFFSFYVLTRNKAWREKLLVPLWKFHCALLDSGLRITFRRWSRI